jgi:hypothetical protein
MQKTKNKTIQSKWVFRSVYHSLPLSPSDAIESGNRSAQGVTTKHAVCIKVIWKQNV